MNPKWFHLPGKDECRPVDELLAEKSRLRNRVKARLKKMSQEDRALASLFICQSASRLPAFQNGRVIAFFSSLPSEPDLGLLMELAWAEERQVVVPKICSLAPRTLRWVRIEALEDLVPSVSDPARLLLEPGEDLPEVALDEIDCLFVPGLAFDLAGWRLGRGGGYYDSTLEWIKAQHRPIPHPGVMFSCQEVDRIPIQSHDQRLSCVLTEEGLRLFPEL